MSDTRFTPSEQQALMVSMQHFGTCNCSEPGRWPKRVCDGHHFLFEQDRRVNRPDRLLWVRRTRQKWIDGEWMHMPPPEEGTLIQPALPPAIKGPVPTVAPVEPDAPQNLPW